MNGRRCTLFGRVYVWESEPGGASLRAETTAERDARLDAVSVATDAARARARAIGGDQAAVDATLARIDALQLAATR